MNTEVRLAARPYEHAPSSAARCPSAPQKVSQRHVRKAGPTASAKMFLLQPSKLWPRHVPSCADVRFVLLCFALLYFALLCFALLKFVVICLVSFCSVLFVLFGFVISVVRMEVRVTSFALCLWNEGCPRRIVPGACKPVARPVHCACAIESRDLQRLARMRNSFRCMRRVVQGQAFDPFWMEVEGLMDQFMWQSGLASWHRDQHGGSLLFHEGQPGHG